MSSLEVLEDACARLPHTTRKMFGGHGLFAPNGGMFAGIVDDDRIILKLADADARDELCSLGTTAWQYHGKMGSTTMREWILIPDAFYDDPQQLESWCVRAHRLAPAKGTKPAKAAKKPQPRVAKKATPKASPKRGATSARKPAKPAKAKRTKAT